MTGFSDVFDVLRTAGCEAKQCEFLSEHTSFRIGGMADIFVTPPHLMHLIVAIDTFMVRNIPFTFLGGGTNVLVSDKGVRGAVISTKGMRGVQLLDDCTISAGAGEYLGVVAHFAQQHGLSGLEFAAGIPGTVGGAVCMNAGAFGGQMSDVVSKVRAAMRGHPDDDYAWFADEVASCDMGFGYRQSIVNADMVVYDVTFALQSADSTQVRAKMDDFLQRRSVTQPTNLPSAGSVFKRPPGHFAGKLIEDAGLKGFSIGGAQVSEKHAGFIVNTGRATCQDVLAVMRHIQECVHTKFGVMLEPEIRLLGVDYANSDCDGNVGCGQDHSTQNF